RQNRAAAGLRLHLSPVQIGGRRANTARLHQDLGRSDSRRQSTAAPANQQIMNALPIIVGTLCAIVIAYRYYSAFIAAKVLALDDSRLVPSQTMYDGHNYYPTNKWVLFGHHF